MPDTRIRIDYQRRSGRGSKRLFRIALALALLSALWVGLKFGPVMLRNYRLLAFQGACAKHEIPKDFVVFDSDPTEAEKLIAAGKHERVFSHPGHSVPAGIPSPAGYMFAPWRGLYSAIGPASSRPSDAILFLGMLTSPGGNQRLVCIDVSVIHHGDRRDYPKAKSVYLRWAVIKPGSYTDAPVLITPFNDQYAQGILTHRFDGPQGEFTGFELDNVNDQCRLILWAGEIDSKDSSHVVIHGENRQFSEAPEIHAWLTDNDRIRIRHISQPLEKPSEPTPKRITGKRSV